MKVAYHFNCGDVEGIYDSIFYKMLFNNLLKLNEQFVSSKILVGDLFIYKYLQHNDPHDVISNFACTTFGNVACTEIGNMACT